MFPLVLEVDTTPWFIHKVRRDDYIKNVTEFANYDIADIIKEIKKHFPNGEIHQCLTHRDIVTIKNPVRVKINFSHIYLNMGNIKKYKSSGHVSGTQPIKFEIPISNEDMQIAKKILTMKYLSLEPVNRKLKWAAPESDSYIGVNFHRMINKNGFEIKLKCLIINVHETKNIADQIYQIMGGSDCEFSKQFLNCLKSPSKNQFSAKSFSFYVKDFDTLNNLFFLFNRKDAVIIDVDFYINRDTMNFSDKIMEFCEL